jgi:hypothetical protein
MTEIMKPQVKNHAMSFEVLQASGTAANHRPSRPAGSDSTRALLSRDHILASASAASVFSALRLFAIPTAIRT